MREQLVKHKDKIYAGTNRCTSITVHETANTSKGADAQAHANLQTSGNVRQASWHITVDDTEAIRSYPDTAQCWHGGTREAAESSIAVEICINSDGDYDQAFKNAARVVLDLRRQHGIGRSKVYDHAHWTGKDCPSKMRAAGRWKEFLDLTDPNQKENPVGMISPFEGRLTGHHNDRGGYPGHKGLDIAPPKPGQVGMPVYAAFAGTIRVLHRTAKPGNLKSTWAKGRTGNGMLVSNPDGEGNGYNHMRPLDHFKVGDKVVAGQLLGYNDRSGNQTGPHLHFEMLEDWKNEDSDYAPELAFEKFKIKVGSAPERTSTAPVKPAGGGSKPSKPAAKPAVSADVKKKLKAMGYKNLDAVAVEAYQAWHGLYPDGDWGSKTEAKYQEVVRAQNATKKMLGVPDNWASDGYWGATSKKWAGYTSGRNGWNNPHGYLTKKYINNLKKVGAW